MKHARWYKPIVSACALLLAAGMACAADGNASADALWMALRGGGHVALMRHASAPGVGDPEGFVLADCATQRNLSAQGRSQAAAAGALFRQHGVTRVDVYSSQWCRCLDTARLLDLGPVAPFPALNSFFENDGRQAEQTAQVRALILRDAGRRSLVLVTHQVNITALTGVYPESGEIIVLRPRDGKLELLGRLRASP